MGERQELCPGGKADACPSVRLRVIDGLVHAALLSQANLVCVPKRCNAHARVHAGMQARAHLQSLIPQPR